MFVAHKCFKHCPGAVAQASPEPECISSILILFLQAMVRRPISGAGAETKRLYHIHTHQSDPKLSVNCSHGALFWVATFPSATTVQLRHEGNHEEYRTFLLRWLTTSVGMGARFQQATLASRLTWRHKQALIRWHGLRAGVWKTHSFVQGNPNINPHIHGRVLVPPPFIVTTAMYVTQNWEVHS